MPNFDSWWLAAIAAVIVGSSIWRSLREKRRQSANQEEARYRDKRASRQNDPYGPSRDFGALIDAIETEARAQRAEEKREDRGKVLREWLTIVLIAATFAAIVKQVSEMIRVYEPIAAQADAAKESADAVIKQAEDSERSLILAERAWVGPLDVNSSTVPEVSKPLKVVVTYANTGRSPATEFISSFKDASYSESSSDEIAGANIAVDGFISDCRHIQTNIGSVVYPTSGFSSYSLSHTMDQKTVDEAAPDKRVVVVVGCFVYRSFDMVRHSTFCYFFKSGLTSPQHWNICPGGAYAD